MSGTYRDLEVWQAATQLALQVYRLTAVFPKDERYGMTSQMRRAAVSVASNIAEGKGRSSDKELVQFLCHSRGSLFEIETQHNWRAVGLFHAGRLQCGPTRDSSNWTDAQRTDAISPPAHDSVAL
jgi:23S rRNA-intervening sequence protein